MGVDPPSGAEMAVKPICLCDPRSRLPSGRWRGAADGTIDRWSRRRIGCAFGRRSPLLGCGGCGGMFVVGSRPDGPWIVNVVTTIVAGTGNVVKPDLHAQGSAWLIILVEEWDEPGQPVPYAVFDHRPLGQDIEKGREQQQIGDEQDHQQHDGAGDADDV